MSEIAVQLRSERRRWAHPGSAHDRIVKALLWLLPTGIGILGAFLVVAPLVSGGDVSFVLDKNKVEIARDRLQVEKAQYRGEDNKGRAFRIDAGSAVQKSSAEPIVQLNTLSAEITLPEGPATINAQKGKYDMDTRELAIEGPIQFRTTDGYTLDTNDSTVDLKTRRMQSGSAVTGKTPMGVFSGDRMTADLEKRTVSLDGNARLRIVPRQANRR
jgi:lipopolysaccharide export system protein LptC